MARLKPETIASDLRVPERLMLFCLASRTEWRLPLLWAFGASGCVLGRSSPSLEGFPPCPPWAALRRAFRLSGRA